MPTFVRTEKCDGCKGQDKTACMYICSHDLMKLDKDGSETGHAMKAYNQEPEPEPEQDPADYTRMFSNDLMGITRDDLVYIA